MQRRAPDDFKLSLSVTTLGGDALQHHEGLTQKEAAILMGVYLRNGINHGRKVLGRGEVIVRILSED